MAKKIKYTTMTHKKQKCLDGFCEKEEEIEEDDSEKTQSKR
jgi:hypothetical protein